MFELCIIGSKKQVLKCLSNIIIVIAAASTGRDTTNRTDVTRIDHGNNGSTKELYTTALEADFMPTLLTTNYTILRLIRPISMRLWSELVGT
jgi:hypothetical protein